jgi:hypothetical protein
MNKVTQIILYNITTRLRPDFSPQRLWFSPGDLD